MLEVGGMAQYNRTPVQFPASTPRGYQCAGVLTETPGSLERTIAGTCISYAPIQCMDSK